MESTLRLRNAGLRDLSLAAAALLFALHGNAAVPDLPATPEPASVAKEVELAAAYLTGHGVQKDERLAAFWYEKAAQAGDPVAQIEIGYFYQIGLGVPADPARAAHWYQLSSANGMVAAKVNLGVAYLWGHGVAKNPAFAAQLFREAANKKSGLAACYLGDLYAMGLGVNQDMGAAQRWFEAGVKLHEPRAAFNLGSMDSAPDARRPNLRKAVELFRISSEAGYVPAMHALGLLLVNHPQLTASPDEAVGLLQRSAQAGSWKSSALLGVLSRDGKLVAADPKDAYYHFRIALLQGGDPAAQLLKNDMDVLARSLGRETTSPLDQAAAAWYQQNHVKMEFIYQGGDRRYPAFALASPEDGLYAGQLLATSPF